MDCRQKATWVILLVSCSCCIIWSFYKWHLRSSCRMQCKVLSERESKFWSLLPKPCQHTLACILIMSINRMITGGLFHKILLWKRILPCLSTLNSCLNQLWTCSTNIYSTDIVTANKYCTTSQFSMPAHCGLTIVSSCIDWGQLAIKPPSHFIHSATAALLKPPHSTASPCVI